ncbi:hypothetical protein [Kamptonema sp. UHCC 0994]|uniref:hypothetical protein n=1 Tax=Kamptonema sp. UHCC 0994 TaxID=3031329 RepID=UPI0023BA4AC0|nr:hypothetical protein [Kamptonema sp. UHCC 0994]MDF0556852.1 hypothetical protein [Kamptonema sp. UHCC 0994]
MAICPVELSVTISKLKVFRELEGDGDDGFSGGGNSSSSEGDGDGELSSGGSEGLEEG